MKKIVGFVLVLFIVLIIPVSASGQKDAVNQNEITVIFPQHEADKIGAFPARVKDFTAQTGIKVNLIQLGWDEVSDKVLPELASGGSAYDVVEFDNGWVAKWINAGWVTPLEKFMPAGYTKGMVPGLIKLFSGSDNKLYGIVWNNDTRFFYYNAAKLKAAGIANPPATWEELIKQSKILQSKKLVKYGFAAPWKAEWALANEFHFWAYTFGGKVVSKKGEFDFQTDPNTLAALKMMKRFLTEGVVDPASLTYNQEAVMNLFLKGETAFLPQGISGLMAYVNNPDLSTVMGQISVGQVPGAKIGLSAALTLPEALAIPKNSKNKENAWKFIKFMTSRDSNKKLAEEIGVLPIWIDLFADKDLVKKYPYWIDFKDQMNTAKGLSTITWYDDFADKCITETQKYLSGNISAKETLNNMANLLSEFKNTP